MSEVVNIPQLRFPEFSGEWKDKIVGDVGKASMCKRILKDQTTAYGDVPFYKIGTFGKEANAFISTKVFEEFKAKYSFPNKGDILISASGTIGRTVVYDGESAYFQDSNIVWIANDEGLVLNRFLIYCYKNTRWNTENTTIARLYNENLRSIPLVLPTKPEQQKIAAFLTAVDNKIEQLSKKQVLLGEYKKGLMQQIFSQEIRFKADDGSDFPNWEEKKIVELAKTSIGLVTSMTPYYVDKGVPLIRNNDIFQNKVRKEKLIQLDYTFDELNKNRRLIVNDIVTVHTGDIGVSAVIDEELNGCQGFATLNTRILNKSKVNSLFLCWYYNSTQNIKYALSMATGDGRSNYNLKDFNKAIIPLPCFEEQTKIANFLSFIDNKIEQVGKQLDESKQFKKALLQQMFV
jgi:type I restriction enzyme S subunit